MDALADNSTLQVWLIHYGSFALFVLLTVGILALPVPEETLMVLAGVLMSQGKLQIPYTIIAAILGSLSGITASYVLGRTAGHFLVKRSGKWIGISQEHIDKAHAWFERFGKWTLFIGYFIPGVRHFTGFSAGMSYLEFKEFALFAYSGALIWVATFLSIGYFFGSHWFSIFENIEINIDDVLTVVIFVSLAYLAYIIKKRSDKSSNIKGNHKRDGTDGEKR
jgi:membrane protein DedA with SNARE-associated domain